MGKLLHEMSRRDEAQHSTNNAHLKAKATYEYAMTSPSKLFFTMIRKQVDWERDCLTTLDLAQNKKKLILLELHVEHPAPNFPSLVELAPTLDRWRAEADRRGVEFFAFTLLREPVAHALSFFNFFHVGSNKIRATPTRKDHDYWNPFKPLPLSEKNLLHSYYANDRQCRMLNSDPEATFAAPRDLVWDDRRLFSQEEIALSKQPCQYDRVHDALFKTLDWVGTTENLSNETLPLLTKIISNDPSLGRYNPPFKVFDKNPTGFVGMKKHDLSKKTMKVMLERTELDRRLYAQVTRDFRLADFGWDYQSPVNG